VDKSCEPPLLSQDLLATAVTEVGNSVIITSLVLGKSEFTSPA
jgi:hypothetical protein